MSENLPLQWFYLKYTCDTIGVEMPLNKGFMFTDFGTDVHND